MYVCMYVCTHNINIIRIMALSWCLKGLRFLSDWRNLPSKAPYLAADGVTLECDQSLDDSYAGYLYHSQVDDACAGLNYSSYDMVCLSE
jgi:hypothetical protein